MMLDIKGRRAHLFVDGCVSPYFGAVARANSMPCSLIGHRDI